VQLRSRQKVKACEHVTGEYTACLEKQPCLRWHLSVWGMHMICDSISVLQRQIQWWPNQCIYTNIYTHMHTYIHIYIQYAHDNILLLECRASWSPKPTYTHGYLNTHMTKGTPQDWCACVHVHPVCTFETQPRSVGRCAAAHTHHGVCMLNQAKCCHTYKYTFALTGMQVDHMHASVLTFAHASSVFVALSNVPRGQLVHSSTDVSQYVPTAHYVCVHFFMFVCVLV
jgi:hypothetical protein